MRSSKPYVTLIIILIIFALIMLLVVARKNIKEEKVETTIIVGDTSVWNYTKKRWINVKKSSTISSINWEKFQVYENNKYLGEYSTWYDSDASKWYYFDNEKDYITPNGKVLAYKSNSEIKIDEYEEKEISASDKQYVNHVLEENKISTSAKFTSNYKVEIDFDNDSKNETFYVLTNTFPTEFEPDQIFSIVFMVKDDNIYYLYKSIDDNKVNNGCKPYFNYFFDLNNDKVDEIILSCGRYSEKGTIDMLYKFIDNEFKIQISNQ